MKQKNYSLSNNKNNPTNVSSVKRVTTHVFTSGYCSNHSKRGGRAGMGIYLKGTSIDNTNNRSWITDHHVHKQASDTASLLAVEKVVDCMCKKQTHSLCHLLNASSMVVIHTDTKDTAAYCTTKGMLLEQEGFPPRSNIETIKRLYLKAKPLRDEKRLKVVYTPEHEKEYRLAKRLSKNAVDYAVYADDKEQSLYLLNSDIGVCMYDDGPIHILDVPSHDYAYAFSKGAWWDKSKRTFFVYENDVGSHYDSCRIDYINLRSLYGR